MAQSASRSRSPCTETVASVSSQGPLGRAGAPAGLSARTVARLSLREACREDRSAIGAPRCRLQKLAQPPRQFLPPLLRPRRLLDLRPSLRRPDLDPLHRPRPGDFLDQTDVLAQSGRDEDA